MSEGQLLEKLQQNKDWRYNKTVHAHRSYMQAMSTYKLYRYGVKEQSNETESIDALVESSNALNLQQQKAIGQKLQS